MSFGATATLSLVNHLQNYNQLSETTYLLFHLFVSGKEQFVSQYHFISVCGQEKTTRHVRVSVRKLCITISHDVCGIRISKQVDSVSKYRILHPPH